MAINWRWSRRSFHRPLFMAHEVIGRYLAVCRVIYGRQVGFFGQSACGVSGHCGLRSADFLGKYGLFDAGCNEVF
ncbi:hypothetical protein, partial [Xylella fastidiosa]|uniref:hypothetical protein n=1 Tax=Xylella fastidiosa TaxID=2371 RepID=UPI001EEA4482